MNKVYCYTKDNNNIFYITVHGKEYYLFSQDYRKGVNEFYKNGVVLDSAINHSIGRRDKAIHRTMDKLRMYIRYVEKEYDVQIMRKTMKRSKAHGTNIQ